MRLLPFIFLLLFCSCNTGNEGPAGEAAINDSLTEALDSPELKALNDKILQDPSNDSLYQERALLYLRLEQPEAAINDAKRAIRIDSTDVGNYLSLVDIYFSQNQTRLAKDLLLIIEQKFPRNTEALLKLAEMYWLVRQYQNGIDYVNKALRIDEHLARAYYIKGGIYRESGDTTRAISSLVTATEQNTRYIDAYYDLGVIYSARKNPVAFQYFENVLRINPDHPDAAYGRAKLLQDLGRIDDAVTAYKELSEKSADCVRCHYNLGAIYLELMKDYQKAVDEFTETIKLEPGNPQNYFARGYSYAKLGDEESARADYRVCLKIDPAFDAAALGLSELEKK